MGLDFSLSAFIGAGGGFSFLLVAGLILASRGARVQRLLLANVVGLHGLMYSLLALTTPEAPEAGSADSNIVIMALLGALHLGVIALAATLTAAAFSLSIARAASRRAFWFIASWLVVLLAMAIAFAIGGGIAPHKGDAAAMPKATHYIFMLVLVSYAATMAAVTALAFHWKAAPHRSPGIPAYVFGLSSVSLATLASVSPTSTPEALLAAFAIASVLPWLPLGQRDGSRTAVVIALALLSWAVFWQIVFPRVLATATNFQGAMGVVEVAAAFAMAVALLRHRPFGISPPTFAKAGGAATATALAALFIVAQIAQNFLSAEYGLLMGGAVAGAFLFAATPIHRALEGRRARTPGTDSVAVSRGTNSEEAYRKALRIALRARALTREDEIQLYELADDLGIRAGRARALFAEIEKDAQQRS